MKIGFFEIEDWEKSIIQKHFSKDEIDLSNSKIDADNIPGKTDYEAISIFIDSEIDEKVLNHFPNLKFIATRSTGFDHIDIESCKKKNILVSTVPDYGSRTVAEYTFGLILNLTRKMSKAMDQAKEREEFSFVSLRGMDIRRKVLGVIGVGKIGKEVIRIAKAFDMQVVATAPRPDEHLAKDLGFRYVSLEELLKQSDIVTIHCPYNSDTKHLINKNNIRFFKKGAYLVNTARGGIVETPALIQALEEKILAGAGLDVLEEEGSMEDELELLSKKTLPEEKLKNVIYGHILMSMPNVLVTPHNAFNSQEALERILHTTIENIKSFASGSPVNLT
jgi:D-lactate dehydrogenase